MTENAVVIKASEVLVGDKALSYGGWLTVDKLWKSKFVQMAALHPEAIVAVKREIDVDAAVKRWASVVAKCDSTDIKSVKLVPGEWQICDEPIKHKAAIEIRLKSSSMVITRTFDNYPFADLIKKVLES